MREGKKTVEKLHPSKCRSVPTVLLGGLLVPFLRHEKEKRDFLCHRLAELVLYMAPLRKDETKHHLNLIFL